ncbi:MAG: class I SAM-dependent methyltransferase [Clostridiales bacterium]|nr:class I SAM-dependent methyltransferase [Clostridiales bacterium]
MMEQLQLTPRLQVVADLVPEGANLVDVGTDHAHLPVWLLLNGRIAAAIASDIRPGPLERARGTVEAYRLQERVSLRLCPGLEGVSPHEADTVTICGMGGDMMIGILEAAPWTKEGVTLILQPQSGQPRLRRWLTAHGYAIQLECLAKEAHRWYPVLLVRGGSCAALSPSEALAGPERAWRQEPLRLEYLIFLRQQCSRQLDAVLRSEKAADVNRRAELAECVAALDGWIQARKEGAAT